MPKIKILFFFFFVITNVFSQGVDPDYLSYKYNMNIINAAYAGAEGEGVLNLGFRRQSFGLEGDPVTQMISYSRPVGKKVGLGVSIVNDEFFIAKQTSVAVDFSYQLQLAEERFLYFGLKGGAAIYKLDLGSLGNGDDPLFSSSMSTFNPTLGTGIYLKDKKYYVTISSPNILSANFQKPVLEDGIIVSEEAKAKFHLYTGGGYIFDVTQNLKLSPSIFARFIDSSETMVDINTTADIYSLVEMGVTYRVNTSFIGTFFFKLIKLMDFGYAYETVILEFSNVSSGTHEFLLRFRF